jgi:hypothetical protein
MSTYQEGHIECPFYSSQDNYCIFCESYIKAVKHNKLSFNRPELKKKYIDKYCKVNGGKGCMHNKIMSYLYDSGVLE